MVGLSNNKSSYRIENCCFILSNNKNRFIKERKNFNKLEPVQQKKDGKQTLIKKSKKIGLSVYIIEISIENGYILKSKIYKIIH